MQISLSKWAMINGAVALLLAACAIGAMFLFNSLIGWLPLMLYGAIGLWLTSRQTWRFNRIIAAGQAEDLCLLANRLTKLPSSEYLIVANDNKHFDISVYTRMVGGQPVRVWQAWNIADFPNDLFGMDDLERAGLLDIYSASPNRPEGTLFGGPNPEFANAIEFLPLVKLPPSEHRIKALNSNQFAVNIYVRVVDGTLSVVWQKWSVLDCPNDLFTIEDLEKADLIDVHIAAILQSPFGATSLAGSRAF